MENRERERERERDLEYTVFEEGYAVDEASLGLRLLQHLLGRPRAPPRLAALRRAGGGRVVVVTADEPAMATDAGRGGRRGCGGSSTRRRTSVAVAVHSLLQVAQQQVQPVHPRHHHPRRLLPRNRCRHVCIYR